MRPSTPTLHRQFARGSAALLAVALVAACGGSGGGSGGGGGSSGGGGGPSDAPDLVVALVAFDPPQVTAGATLSVSDTVSNIGTRAASNVRVGIYLSSDASVTATDRLLGFRSIASLDVGANSSAGGTLTIPTTVGAGTYFVGAIVDDLATIAERSETNNVRLAASTVAVAPAILPDLEPAAIGVLQTSVLAGGMIDVSDSVRNSGVAAAGAFQVGIFLSSDATLDDADVLLGVRAVPSLAAGALSSASDVLVIPPSIASGTWWIGARVDAQNAVSELDELDNALVASHSIQVTAPPRPNLVMSAFSIASTSVDSGTSLGVQDTVSNVGPGAATSFEIAVYLSSDPDVTRTDTRLGARTLPLLASGASDSSAGALVIPADVPGGTYWVGAIADAGLDVLETLEADNTRVAAQPLTVTVPPRPDLVPVSLSFTPTVVDTTLGETVHVSESLTNSGVVPAGAFRVGVYLSTNNVISTSDVLLGSRDVGGLAVGASSSATSDLAVPAGVGAGTYYVGLIVDDLGQELELSEANDALLASSTLDVVASPLPQPDLVVQSASYGPHAVLVGQSIQVQTEVRNVGNLSASAFKIGVYLSSDDQIAADDLRIGERNVAQLGAGFGTAASAPYVVPVSLPAGTYYVGVIADDLLQVAESVETNNALRASGTVVVSVPPPPAPDLIVNATSFTPSQASAGQLLQLSATLRNQGDLGAGAFRVAFYASSDATVDAQDVLLGFQSLSALDANQTFVGTISATLPASLAAGDYTIGALVDDALAVSESVESNNVLVASTLLHVP